MVDVDCWSCLLIVIVDDSTFCKLAGPGPVKVLQTFEHTMFFPSPFDKSRLHILLKYEPLGKMHLSGILLPMHIVHPEF